LLRREEQHLPTLGDVRPLESLPATVRRLRLYG